MLLQRRQENSVVNSEGANPIRWRSDRRAGMSLRNALAAGVALAFVMSFAGNADAVVRNSNRTQIVSKTDNKRDLAKANPFGELPKGPLQMVISIDQQHVTLYANGVRVAQSRVSTGTAGRPTPTGIFSVIEKDRWHRSNLYDNAPMFYMQRLTWSGVAMHEGILPGYPASHGCIRMPTEFASRLWVTTRLGVRVVIARNDPAPYAFDHPNLFNPKQQPTADRISEIRPIVFAQAGTVIDDAAKAPGDADHSPDTPQVVTEATTLAASVEDSAASSAVHSIEAAPPPAAAPIEVENIAPTLEPRSTPTPAASEAPTVAPSVAAPPIAEPEKREPSGAEPNKPAPPRTRTGEPAKKTGQVAVFISGKEKKIFVRQGFVPVFEMPVEIADPDRPLGTHVFTALELADGGARMRWNAITMPPEHPRPAVGKGNRKTGRTIEPAPAEMRTPATAAEALDRITMPQEAIDRIGELLIPGSSLIVSDHGLGSETGRYTEFVVLTR
jgi:hypothetical protein